MTARLAATKGVRCRRLADQGARLQAILSLSSQFSLLHWEDGMRRVPLIIAVVCIVLAVLIFVFAAGARRVYAGVFFALLGVVTGMNAMRGNQREPQ